MVRSMIRTRDYSVTNPAGETGAFGLQISASNQSTTLPPMLTLGRTIEGGGG